MFDVEHKAEPFITVENKTFINAFFLLTVLVFTILFVFLILMPFVLTLNLNYVFPINDNRNYEKIFMLFWSIVWIYLLPKLWSSVNRKKYLFYNDKLLINTYLFKDICIYYSDMDLTVEKGKNFFIFRYFKHNNIHSPFKYIGAAILIGDHFNFEIDKLNNFLKTKVAYYSNSNHTKGGLI